MLAWRDWEKSQNLNHVNRPINLNPDLSNTKQLPALPQCLKFLRVYRVNTSIICERVLDVYVKGSVLYLIEGTISACVLRCCVKVRKYCVWIAFYTSLRKGDSNLKHNSLTFIIPCLTPPSRTRPWPICVSLPPTTVSVLWPSSPLPCHPPS